MICEVADSPEMVAYAKEMGAKGITISGVCCTSNEVAMRRGIPMAGNFLQQENVVLTGAEVPPHFQRQVPEIGFEPTTPALGERCSIQRSQ